MKIEKEIGVVVCFARSVLWGIHFFGKSGGRSDGRKVF